MKEITPLEALDNLRDKIVYNAGSYQDCLEWLDICKEELKKSTKREKALQEIFDNTNYVMVKYPAFILDVNTSISKETAEFLKEYIHE